MKFSDKWDKQEKKAKEEEARRAVKEGKPLSKKQWLAGLILLGFTVTGIVAGLYWGWKALETIFN